MSSPEHGDIWPDLPYAEWAETCATLHLWTQIVGKIRLAQTPWLNHSWHVPLYVSPYGLTTGSIPHGTRTFEMAFDFLDGVLAIRASDGARRTVALAPRAVADFHAAVMAALDEIDLTVRINRHPSEIADAIPFDEDYTHAAYDAAYARRFWQALVQADRVLRQFRTGFLGKSSPVHFFWGSFDLAVTRFSGRRAPPHPGGIPSLPDRVVREAYSHEVMSAGFWPGGSGIDYAAFYAYAYPQPEGFREAAIEPEAAFYSETLGEFLLPYDAVRGAADPDAALIAFLETAYGAAADTGQWNRAELDCAPGTPGIPRAIA